MLKLLFVILVFDIVYMFVKVFQQFLSKSGKYKLEAFD